MEEPAPGVTVVTEIEATEVREPSVGEPEESDDCTPRNQTVDRIAFH
jgi:hypothetical protein